MSKARITYRFEHNQKAVGGERSEGEKREHRAAPEAGPAPGAAASAPTPEARRGANVIPLRHYEFEVSTEPVVVEEGPKRGEGGADIASPSKSPGVQRIDADYPFDYGAWKDSASAEADELERIIRETGTYRPDDEAAGGERRRGKPDGGRASRASLPPPAPPRRAPYDRHPFDEPDDRDAEAGYWSGAREEDAPLRRASRRSGYHDGPSWWKVAASVVGAIATGVLFGTFVLNLFTGEPADGANKSLQANQPAPGAEGPTAGDSAAVGAGVTVPEGGDSAGETTTAAIDLPERRMYLLQNGMFESLESARALAEEMKAKGLAATIEEGEKFFVYAGVTTDRDAALRAGLKLQAADVEVYVKPYDLPSVQQVRWTSGGEADALGDYIATGSALVQMIGDLTLVHLDGDEAVSPEGATLAKLKAEHLGLTELSAKAAAGLPTDAQPMIKRMDDAALHAIVAIEEYAAHPSHAYLWTAQSSLMDYMIAEKQLLTSIATR